MPFSKPQYLPFGQGHEEQATIWYIECELLYCSSCLTSCQLCKHGKFTALNMWGDICSSLIKALPHMGTHSWILGVSTQLLIVCCIVPCSVYLVGCMCECMRVCVYIHACMRECMHAREPFVTMFLRYTDFSKVVFSLYIANKTWSCTKVFLLLCQVCLIHEGMWSAMHILWLPSKLCGKSFLYQLRRFLKIGVVSEWVVVTFLKLSMILQGFQSGQGGCNL